MHGRSYRQPSRLVNSAVAQDQRESALSEEARGEWLQHYALTRLFIAKQLGHRPRRLADQARAIAHASDVLGSLEGAEAVSARYFLAVEYVAQTEPELERDPDWHRAVETVQGATEADVRRWARGGMVLRAADPDAWDDGSR